MQLRPGDAGPTLTLFPGLEHPDCGTLSYDTQCRPPVTTVQSLLPVSPGREWGLRLSLTHSLWGRQRLSCAQGRRGREQQVQNLRSGVTDIKDVVAGTPSDAQHCLLQKQAQGPLDWQVTEQSGLRTPSRTGISFLAMKSHLQCCVGQKWGNWIHFTTCFTQTHLLRKLRKGYKGN